MLLGRQQGHGLSETGKWRYSTLTGRSVIMSAAEIHNSVLLNWTRLVERAALVLFLWLHLSPRHSWRLTSLSAAWHGGVKEHFRGAGKKKKKPRQEIEGLLHE